MEERERRDAQLKVLERNVSPPLAPSSQTITDKLDAAGFGTSLGITTIVIQLMC